MFKFVYKRFQTSTLFEKLLLITGIGIGIIGFWFINKVYYISFGMVRLYQIGIISTNEKVIWFSHIDALF